jgi:MAF protein
VDEGQIMGKPVDAQDARKMLRRLRGKTHNVLTVLSIAVPETGMMIIDCCIAKVPMRTYSDEEIDQYIQSGDPFDKAGAYAIQSKSFHPVENYYGCYACVMGLPLCHVVRQMKKLGLRITENPAPICADQLSYSCQVSSSVLSFTDQITCCA